MSLWDELNNSNFRDLVYAEKKFFLNFFYWFEGACRKVLGGGELKFERDVTNYKIEYESRFGLRITRLWRF
jgi:hypothetical protein